MAFYFRTSEGYILIDNLDELIKNLIKRRKIVLLILLFVAFAGVLFDSFYRLTPPSYIDPKWRMTIVYALVAYKIVELFVIYLVFYKRHLSKILTPNHSIEDLKKFKKNARRFFFLVPQGSIVFGILSYKLSANLIYLLFFLFVASVVVLIVNPKRLNI